MNQQMNQERHHQRMSLQLQKTTEAPTFTIREECEDSISFRYKGDDSKDFLWVNNSETKKMM